MRLQIIAGRHKGKKLHVVKSALLRPTTGMVRERLFNICRTQIEGALFLDLFAGVGACGLEAFSRGAEKVIFVERERRHVEAIRTNIATLSAEESCEILSQDVFKACELLERRSVRFDIIFADPPYGDRDSSLSNEVLKLVDGGSLLREGGRLFLEDHQYASTYKEPLATLEKKKERYLGKICLREFIKTGP